MNILARPIKFALSAVLIPALAAPFMQAQTASIALDRTNYFMQTNNGAPMPDAIPFALNFNIRGGTIDMHAWGPAFYKPGSGGVPQSGPSQDTSTGTLNFPSTPNNGTDFSFSHEFASASALASFYPTGAFGIKFQGAGAPTPPLFTAGLNYAAGTYPGVAPQITGANNGAIWGNGLVLNTSGITTMTLNSSAFTEYGNTSYGTVILAGIYDASGNVIAPATVQSYYLPTYSPVHYDQPITQLTLDSSWLTPGVQYLLDIQYGVFASAPTMGTLSGEDFRGVSTYFKRTLIPIRLAGPVLNKQLDFNTDGMSDIVWQNPSTGQVIIWAMNGTEPTGDYYFVTTQPDFAVAATGDFNGDGKSDIVWQNPTTGQIIIWMMDGGGPISYTFFGTQPDWRIVGSGDFNGDGKSDVVWRNPATGQVIIWLLDGTNLVASIGVADEPNSSIVACGDFNGDGNTDIVWQNSTTDEVVVWLMDGTTKSSSVSLGIRSGWRVGGSGDLNGDGKSDLIWQNRATGEVVGWLMHGTAMSEQGTISTQPDFRVVNH